jgi:hypothetical protein
MSFFEIYRVCILANGDVRMCMEAFVASDNAFSDHRIQRN